MWRGGTGGCWAGIGPVVSYLQVVSCESDITSMVIRPEHLSSHDMDCDHPQQLAQITKIIVM